MNRNPHHFIVPSIVCVAFLLECQLCLAQSFDCSKASTDMENVICQHRHGNLGAIDREMGAAYKVLLGAVPAHEKSAVKEAQRLWIRKRDKECMAASAESRESCLTELIGRRNDELEEQLRQRLGLSPAAFKWIEAYSGRHVPEYAADVKDRLDHCSNAPPAINPKFAALAPEGYVSLFGIATHQCDAVLRVYLSCKEPADGYSCGEMLILEDIKSIGARVLGELTVESRTGNSGGIFVPVAFTKDDRHIILKSWMGDPGAGGGQVDYGYDIVARDGETEEKAPLAPKWAIFRDEFGKVSYSKTVFYDEFGKVLYTKNSDALPAFSQPGPQSNSGVLAVKDLATLKERRVLEERDTTFEIVKADEKNRILSIRTTKHAFSSSCPRNAEDSLYCSKKSIQERRIPLP